MRRCRTCSSFYVPSMAWTRRVFDIGTNLMRVKKKGMVVLETVGVLLSVTAINSVRAVIAGARVTRSSSVLRSWRGLAIVMVFFFLVPVA